MKLSIGLVLSMVVATSSFGGAAAGEGETCPVDTAFAIFIDGGDTYYVTYDGTIWQEMNALTGLQRLAGSCAGAPYDSDDSIL